MIKPVKKAPSANKIAKDIRDVIDAYWADQISKDEARARISEYMNNPELRIKIMRRETYTGTFESVMRPKRLETFKELIK